MVRYRDERVDQRDQWAYLRVSLAQRFGWTLDYIDRLSEADVLDILGVLDGIEEGEAE